MALAGFQYSEEHLPAISTIFAFDMLIQNPDRTFVTGQGKPNLLFDGEQFAVIDHELAFSFTSLLGAVPPPWDLRGQRWVESHLFFPYLRQYAERHPLPFDVFFNGLELVTDQFLNEAQEAVPNNWKNERVERKITEHLCSVRGDKDRFRHGLLEALA